MSGYVLDVLYIMGIRQIRNKLRIGCHVSDTQRSSTCHAEKTVEYLTMILRLFAKTASVKNCRPTFV